jgi:DNA-binding CsgD family transcriptional regulator
MPNCAEHPPIETLNRFRSVPQFSAKSEPDWSALLQRLTPDAAHNLRTVVAFACERLNGDGCLYLDPDPASKTGFPQAHVGLTSFAVAELSGSQAAAQARLRDGTGPLAIEAAEEDPVLSGIVRRLGVKSVLLCPVHLAAPTPGLLVVAFKTARRFDHRDLDELGAIVVVIALERARAAADRPTDTKRGDALSRALARLDRARAVRKTLRGRIRKLEAGLRHAAGEREELKEAIGNLHRIHSLGTAEQCRRTLGDVRVLVDAPLSKLKASGPTPRQARWLEMIEKYLQPVASPLEAHFSSGYYHLTPTEIKVAALIKQNQTNKEIGEMLDISTRTVEVHRNNIRRKFGIRNKNVNLRTHLLTLE